MVVAYVPHVVPAITERVLIKVVNANISRHDLCDILYRSVHSGNSTAKLPP